MRSRRTTTQVVSTWIAIVAIVMVAVAPTISHAWGAKDGAHWVQVCSSIGAKWIHADAEAGDDRPGPSRLHPFDQCPYCSVHAHAVAVPASAAATVPVVLPMQRVPTSFLTAPRTLHAWLSANPRAPPLS